MSDLPQGVPESALAGSGDSPEEFKIPSTEELMSAINSMSDLTDEMKKELMDGILTRQKDGSLKDVFGGGVPPIAQGAVAKSVSTEIVWTLALFSIVFLILVFFGYKLYKSLVERERRREEKKRQKLQKKKK